MRQPEERALPRAMGRLTLNRGTCPPPCGKVRYPTRADARRAKAQLEVKPNDGSQGEDATRLSVYRCDRSGWLHVGHVPRWKRLGADRHDPLDDTCLEHDPDDDRWVHGVGAVRRPVCGLCAAAREAAQDAAAMDAAVPAVDPERILRCERERLHSPHDWSGAGGREWWCPGVWGSRPVAVSGG